jgi:hypothetical protein
MNKEKSKTTEKIVWLDWRGFEDIGIRNWHTVARDRKECKRIVLEAKVQKGM